MDADQFIRFVFDQTQGVVVTCNAEEGFKARRWRPGKTLQGVVYLCISTVADRNPRDDVLRRQTQDLVETYAVVLDDVGTKVDKALLKGKLAPTAILRTSMPGGVSNEQWWYVFKDGVEPARAAALIEALAAAGLTDAGAKRADRIMRIPGSLNEKYSPPFATEVLEVHEERLYTFSKVCVGLGVTPTDTPAMPSGPQALPDGMVDPIDQWNYDHDRVTGPVNARGWYQITCPLEHEHTGDATHGCDYKPGMPGVFKCQHEHAGRPPLTLGWYRAWILEQDPAADLSLVPRQVLEELGAKLGRLLGAKPSSVEGEVPETELGYAWAGFEALSREVAGNPLFRLSPQARVAQEVLSDLVHVGIENGYWSIAGKCILKHKAVDDRLFARMLPTGLLDRVNDKGEPLMPMAPSNWLKNQTSTMRVSRLTHRLGAPLIVDDCLNIAPAIPERLLVTGEPEPWLDLISFICRDIEADRDLVLDWMALVATDWTEKPGWHLLLKGEHGTGKNLALRPLVNYMAPEHWEKISASDIDSQFTSFLTRRLVQIDELKMQTRGTISTHDIYNKIKAWTARGNDLIMINDKNTKRYSAADRSAWAITSNASVPLPLEEGDRRFMVIETPRTPWPKEDYDEVVKFLDEGGDQMVIAWLHRRWDGLSIERRKVLFGRAPDTEAKRDLMDASSEGIEGAIKLAIRGQHTPAWPDLMRLEDVIDRLRDPAFTLLPEQLRKQISTQRIWPALKAAGAAKLFGGEVIKHGDRSMRLWCMRASKMSTYEGLGQGKELLDVYADQRTGKLPQGFLKGVPSKKL